MNKCHYDAAGHVVFEWSLLKKSIQDHKSLTILKKFLLCHVVVIPYCTIKVYKDGSGVVDVTLYGTGSVKETSYVLHKRALDSLRRIYKKGGSGGWVVSESKHFVSFTRGAKVIRDPLRRYGGLA